MSKHWSEDRYWTGAANRYRKQRERGAEQLVLNLKAIEQSIYDGEGPAYKAMEAMLSVHEHEGFEGYRGAPRIVLALLQILSEQGQDTVKN